MCRTGYRHHVRRPTCVADRLASSDMVFPPIRHRMPWRACRTRRCDGGLDSFITDRYICCRPLAEESDAMTNLSTVIRRRMLGLTFLMVLAALLSLSIASYLKVFQPVLWVTLHTSHTGLQLNQYADVKIRGVLVGEVRDISSTGDKAVLRLALDPAMVAHIPANVTARLLPKTLFGEKYVALVPPERPSPEP